MGKSLFQSGSASTTCYFKVEQGLFQIGAETVMSKWATVYFKVGHNKCFDNNFTKFTLVKKIQFKQLKIC